MAEVSLFNGKVVHVPPQGGPGWVDTWVGPGGVLIACQLVDNQMGVDALETFYTIDGRVIQYALMEGDDYHTLPELMGEYWERYKHG